MKLLNVYIKSFTVLIFLLPGIAFSTNHFKSFRIDSGLNKIINFTVPVAATDYTIRLVTNANIDPSNFNFRISNNEGTSDLFNIGSPNPAFNNVDTDPIANISLVHSPTDSPNVYQITITPINLVDNTLDLDIENTFSQLVIFAAYFGEELVDISGANPWIRDNATQDQAGNLLNDINNLDDMSSPTNSEFWKSPDVRLSDANGDPTLNPVAEENNTVSVFVNNFGTTNLGSVLVEAFYTQYSAGLPALDSGEWTSLGQNTVGDINPGTSKAAVFSWMVPAIPSTGANHYCIFVRISSGSSTGSLDLDPIDYSSNNVNLLTKTNNNASHRNVKIVASNDGASSVTPPFFFSTPIRFFITNPFKEPRQAEIRIKGLPMNARASDFKIELKNDDRLKLTGMRLASDKIIRRVDPQNPDNVLFVPTHTNMDGANSTKPSPFKLHITNPADLRLAGLTLKGGEKRLVEFNLGLTDKIKGGDKFSIDVENIIDGQVVGGVTNVYDLQPTKPKPPTDIWKIIAIIVIFLLLLMFPIIAKKRK